jgi:hypothetical protein
VIREREAGAKVKVTDGSGERGTVAKKLKVKPQS